ncbi:hypothetical protein GCM10027277_01040 [Pseudoduganella ginsengisoli]|uniref:Uncharacterized protein n=1 Tax=Pseudoduganella ginsengisoli TaxID=1462440 RepID=A0A6L6Q2G9_9BURK|nr:hypothetical protein [Pseudoduganella ginsengisoli]MTW03830.1 hypothetical protein [Pseudoduganella ginsengisoli]
MNVLKNFEALFVVTLGLACAANYVMDTSEAEQPATARAAATTTVAYAAPQDTQVIVVSAKRLTAEQKLQSLRDERKASAQATSRI